MVWDWVRQSESAAQNAPLTSEGAPNPIPSWWLRTALRQYAKRFGVLVIPVGLREVKLKTLKRFDYCHFGCLRIGSGTTLILKSGCPLHITQNTSRMN